MPGTGMRVRGCKCKKPALLAALDTVVVIRLLVGDDARPAKIAEQLVTANPCTVAMSVLMECEWVLRAC